MGSGLPTYMLLSAADSLCHRRYILSNVATGLKALPPPGEGYDDDLSDPSSEDVSAATRLDKVGSSRCWQGCRHVESWPWLTSRPLWCKAAAPHGRSDDWLHHGGLTALQPLSGGDWGEGGGWAHPPTPAWPDALAQQPQSKTCSGGAEEAKCLINLPPHNLSRCCTGPKQHASKRSRGCCGTAWSSTWAWPYRVWSSGNCNRQQPTVTAQQGAPLVAVQHPLLLLAAGQAGAV